MPPWACEISSCFESKSNGKGLETQVANSLDYIANHGVTSTRKLLVCSINVSSCVTAEVQNPQASSLNINNEGITFVCSRCR